MMAIVSAFIALAIMLGIGTIILGSTGLDCEGLESADNINWSKACVDAQEQGIAGYNLLVVALIIMAAVAILAVVRMLG